MIRVLGVAMMGMGLASGAWAAEVGCVSATGVAVTPSEEGRLLVLQAPRKVCTGPAYRLVARGGEAVIVMTPNGHALTPAEALAQFGVAPTGPKPPRGLAPEATVGPAPGGTFSVPNARR